jgi:hypothetical protein
MIEHRFLETWLLINIIVAFLHYSYDGLIWKYRSVAVTPMSRLNA